jgi:hypothetical protein
MDLATKFMREASIDFEINVYKGDDGLYHGIEYVNHPTPSGCDRWLPSISDNRGFDTPEKAIEEFMKLLEEIKSLAEKGKEIVESGKPQREG